MDEQTQQPHAEEGQCRGPAHGPQDREHACQDTSTARGRIARTSAEPTPHDRTNRTLAHRSARACGGRDARGSVALLTVPTAPDALLPG